MSEEEFLRRLFAGESFSALIEEANLRALAMAKNQNPDANKARLSEAGMNAGVTPAGGRPV